MTTLLVTISGCSGGSKGPLSIYDRLQSHWNTKEVTILQIDTIPDSVESNINLVVQTVFEQAESYEEIYLVGYSMGGAVAVGAAVCLLEKEICRIKGITLLATQTEGLEGLRKLEVPVLFYHGSADTLIYSWEVVPMFHKYKGPKKMVEVLELRHDLRPKDYSYVSSRYVKALTSDIVGEIKTMMSRSLKSLSEEPQTKHIPSTKMEYLWNKFYSFSNSLTLSANSAKNLA